MKRRLSGPLAVEASSFEDQKKRARLRTVLIGWFLALIVSEASAPDEMTAAATVPAATAPVTERPAACEPVEESTP